MHLCIYAYGMDQQETVLDIENRAWELRVSISYVCQLAGVHPTTFSRWKKTARNPDPVEPNMGTIRKLYAALNQIAAENRRRSTVRQAKVAA